MSISTLRIHSTPGRLRVRLSELKRDKIRACHLQGCLAGARGVRSVELNPLTGSLLAHFDPNLSTHETLLKVLSDNALNVAAATAEINTKAAGSRAAGITGMGKKATEIAWAYAGKMLIEHAVEALIAVVL